MRANSILPAANLGTNKIDANIAIIAGEPITLALDYETDLHILKKRNFKNILSKSNAIDMVLIESSTRPHEQEWSMDLQVPEQSEALTSIKQLCKAQSIPIIFWHTLGCHFTKMFLDLAKYSDNIFATDQQSIISYTELGVKCVELLEHAVSPNLHNPFTYKSDLPLNKKNPKNLLFSKWSDLIEFPNDISSTLTAVKNRLRIVDNNWLYMSNKLLDTPELEDSIEGSINYLQFVQCLKETDYQLQLTPSLGNVEEIKREALEAIACDCLTLSNNFNHKLLKIGNINLIECPTSENLSEAIEQLNENTLSSKAIIHKKRREIYSKHTYSNRIHQIFNNLAKDYPQQKADYFASIITCTKRPHVISNILNNFNKQSYKNKELIVVLNSSCPKAYKEFHSMLMNLDNVQFLAIHESQNIGFCLNTAINRSNGDLWFKMDDDDFYGKNYILDLVQLHHQTNAQVFGKPPALVYFEGSDKTYLRQNMRAAFGYDREYHLCGATISGTKQIHQKIPFSTERRANVDSNFIERCISNNIEIASADNYNFVIFRSKNLNDHTWRMTDETISYYAKFYCDSIPDELLSV